MSKGGIWGYLLTTRPLPDGTTLFEVDSHLDDWFAGTLREAIDRVLNSGRVRLIVDLNGMGFMNSTGLDALVGGLEQARAHSGNLVVVCKVTRLRRIVQITRLTKHFRVVPDVASARRLYADDTVLLDGMSKGGARDFRVTSRALPNGITLIKVTGNLDVSTAPVLRRALDSVMSQPHARLIVDVNRVEGTTVHLMIYLVFVLQNVLREVQFGSGGLVVVCKVERLLRYFQPDEMDKALAFFIVPDLAAAQKLYKKGTVFTQSPATLAASSPPRTSRSRRSSSAVATAIEVAAIGLGASVATVAVGATWYWLVRRKPRTSLHT